MEDLETRKAGLEKPMHDNPSDYVLIQEVAAELVITHGSEAGR
jgi:hypothetical protein